MAENSLDRYPALQTINIMIRVLLKRFLAIWATAKVQFLTGPLQRGRPLQRFFSQASRAYDHIPGFLEVSPGIRGEPIGATLAAEMVFFTLVAAGNRFVLADPEPHQGTTAMTANERLHCSDLRICGSSGSS